MIIGVFRQKKVLKIDSEYTREGTCSIFVFVESLRGWRHSSIRKIRTALDWAEEIKYLLTECYPNHSKIILVMDNLNTHVIASLYKKYPAQEAHSYAKRLEIYYTPKHGRWLNIAERESNLLTRQCLARRLDSLSKVQQELAVWHICYKRQSLHEKYALRNCMGDCRKEEYLSFCLVLENHAEKRC